MAAGTISAAELAALREEVRHTMTLTRFNAGVTLAPRNMFRPPHGAAMGAKALNTLCTPR